MRENVATLSLSLLSASSSLPNEFEIFAEVAGREASDKDTTDGADDASNNVAKTRHNRPKSGSSGGSNSLS